MNSLPRSYFNRFYRLVAVAVAVMTAVLTGSLILGDSVRGSLVERVDERLGDAETLIQTGTGFLSDTILASPLLSDAKGYLMTEGFISSDGQMIPVTVWGTDDEALKPGEVLINEILASHLFTSSPFHLSVLSSHLSVLSPIVLHLPSNNLVGSSSLFVSQSYATQLRLDVKGVKSKQNGGNLLLRQEQVRPQNIFMNRQELAEALGVKGKINVILSPEQISEDQFNSIWKPEFSGLSLTSSPLHLFTFSPFHLSVLTSQFSVLTSHLVGTDRVFLPQEVVTALNPSARYLAYFVNSLGNIPYSFVTATDQLHGDETVLTDYAAQRLNVHVGDSVTMEYYVSHGGLKQLETRSHRFCVSRIVPMGEFQQQAELITADFPGLSGVDRCTDWDSDLPIDMSRITKADEDYWEVYRQLPKALVSLDAVGADWTGWHGVATKVVTESTLSNLQAQIFGIAVVQPRAAALRAAQNGTDFGMLFLALGFFIIIAAMLLMLNPLSEMYLLRRSEIQLYSVLGFSKRQVLCRFFAEALPIVLLAAPIGVLLGYAYAALVLWLLGGPWSGATHTDGFALHANALTVGLSLVVAVVMALLVLLFAVRAGLLDGRRRQNRLAFWTLALGVLIVFTVGLNRPDASRYSEEATGGYLWYGESRIPIQYDLNTAAGRHRLHLDDLPADARFLQLPKHTEDEAGCLNLNRVEAPSVVGMRLEDMTAFGIDTCRLNGLRRAQSEVISVAIDEEAMLWSLMKQVGDTLTWHASDGREIKAVIAATYPTGILHGNAIMPLEAFSRIWPDETGSRIILGDHAEIATGLSDYGVNVMTTTDRLRMFFEVTDTYLSIFLSLGGLGLLLGLASLLIVIRKNLAARREEIRLYHILGFPTERIVGMLRREQIVVPLLAIGAGMLGSLLISSLLHLFTSSPLSSHLSPLSSLTVVLLVLLVLFTWIIIHISINSKTIKQCETY